MDVRLKGITLEEALQIIEEDNVEAEEVFIEPPEVGLVSDEDSGDEDGQGKADNLTGRQLRVRAEVVLAPTSTAEQGYFSDSDDDVENRVDDPTYQPDRPGTPEELERPQPKKRRTLANVNTQGSDDAAQSRGSARQREPKPKRKPAQWSPDLNAPPSYQVFSESDFSEFRDLSPIELFELFIDEEIVDFLVKETSRYALFLNEPDPKVTVGEMRAFIGILMLSGYKSQPGKRTYWENAPDFYCYVVSKCMRRDRFLKICRFMHCADNLNFDKACSDKMWKLRPLVNLLSSKFMKNFKPEQNLDFDESMIPYYGRNSCKQFIRGKPIRFGYKAWCLNTPDGYLVSFDIYQGKRPNQNDTYDVKFGKCAAPLLEFLDKFPASLKSLPFMFYFDNLFTSMNLLTELKNRGYCGTGTMRENRVPKDCPIASTHEMKKRARGSYDVQRSTSEHISVVRWVDNAVVTVASTCHSVNPIGKVGRYSQTEKKRVKVSRPDVVAKYNYFMSGTDKMDQDVSLYRISIRGKKWWWPIFCWLFDVTTHNAWRLHCSAGGRLPSLQFRRERALAYLQKYKVLPLAPGKTPTSKTSRSGSRVSDDVRFDGVNHLIRECEERRRCVDCPKRIHTECFKCNVGLCTTCFLPFHIK